MIQRHTVAKMKLIDLKTLRLLSSPESLQAAETFLRTNKAGISYAENETVKATVTLEVKVYCADQKNEERNFDTSCEYNDGPSVIACLNW